VLFAALATARYPVSNPWTPHRDLGFFEHGLDFEGQIHDNVWVAWELDASEDNIILAMAFNTPGWIGLGPTETGSMIGANPCVVREDPVGSGNYKALAYHSLSMTEPDLNEVQNCRLLDFNQANNETYAKITRPRIGCRPEDMDISLEWIMRWVVAWGTTQDFYYHGTSNRITFEMDPRFGLITYPPPPDDSLIFDADLDGAWNLRADRDCYQCRGIELPQDQRYHVIQFDPIYYDIAPCTYHHVILYECPGGLPREWEDGEPAPCPFVGGTLGCTRFWVGWALGQPAVVATELYPPFAMGAGDGGIKDVFLETHIDNPDLLTNITDGGWGFRLWYTADLWDDESAIMGLYVGIPFAGLPPKEAVYNLEGQCVPGCSRFLPDRGIYIYGAAPHMHAAGIGAWIKHIRDGEELGEVFRQDAWDPNWQGPRFRSEDKFVQFLPGDALVGVCVYNTLDRDRRTFFGEGYMDEMCMFYISYYPRTNMVTCIEWPGRGDDMPRGFAPIFSLCSMAPYFALERNHQFEPYPYPPSNCRADTGLLTAA